MYGLILFMGIEMFINEGLFRGIKLIFVDRSLFNEGQQGIVGENENESEFLSLNTFYILITRSL